jgi:hypothetical protein
MAARTTLNTILRDARKCALLQDDGENGSNAATPAKIHHPVTRMISLLTSNKPDISNSARLSGRIDTDDFHDRKPVSLTMMIRKTHQPENNRP